MKILVINAGSSSLKMQLFESKNFSCLYKDLIDRIGLDNGIHKNYEAALNHVLKDLISKKIIKDLNEIKIVGHRVVHGGEAYRNPAKITPQVLKEIKKLCTLAPLHNPPNLEAILACKKVLKLATQVAVFDTAFHQTIPEKAFIYSISYEYYNRFGIRRYGFHGTSHSYVSKQTNKLLKTTKSKIVTCHLGNGASIAAIVNGKSIDTSMGFTPLEGLTMGTRCGDIDPAIVFELMKKLNLPAAEIEKILNKNSGLKGISRLSSDMRDLWAAGKKNKLAKLAITIFCYKIAKYIGSYAAAMNGLDAITFTAGIGEKAWYVRKEVCDYLNFLGVKLDSKNNKKNAVKISSSSSKIKVFVIPTDEAKEIMQSINNNY